MRTILLAALLLSGCAQMAQQLPSVSYCSKVQYERVNADVKINAECKL